jgi:hypothetical protein
LVVAGNAVDQVEADLVLLSTEAVHSKAVDANLLAEFVDCPGDCPGFRVWGPSLLRKPSTGALPAL